uniref:DM2 domain-containing protein n=1 Tax=viral metagenome TaxID=1070528 RepID=A0A6C0HYL0_9ZZZZ
MPRVATKTTTPTTAPVVNTPAPVKEKKVKVAKDSKEPAKETVVKPVVDAPVDDVVIDASSLGAKLSNYSTKIQELSSVVSLLKTEYKQLEKIVARELKNAQKAASKKKRSSGNRAPSGFVKPTLISDELALFLGKEKGTELARTAVSKEINAYIRANSLQDKENGRKIHADAKLAKLLKLGKEDELTYFNLQKYMKNHFIKTVPAVVAPSV